MQPRLAADPKPTVVIHTNDQQMVAALVSAHSLKSRSTSPHLFHVRLLRLEDYPELYKRHNQRFVWEEGDAPLVWNRRNHQTFGPLRRMVPSLLGFQGRALVIDPDVFAIADVYELLIRDMGGKAILCHQRSEWREGRRPYSSAVMLLDCSKLTHWQWQSEMDKLFSGQLRLGPYLSLLDEPPDHIGLFEEEWNHFDTLIEKTKLLHNTRIDTQPWKTGLLADYYYHAHRRAGLLAALKHAGRIVLAPLRRHPVRYKPHPDLRQEQLFFALLRECLEVGSITTEFLQAAIRKNYLRKDAFAVIAKCAPIRGGPNRTALVGKTPHPRRRHGGLR